MATIGRSPCANLVHVSDIHVRPRHTRVYRVRCGAFRVLRELDVDFSMAATDTSRPLCENANSPEHTNPRGKSKKYTNQRGRLRVTLIFTTSLRKHSTGRIIIASVLNGGRADIYAG